MVIAPFSSSTCAASRWIFAARGSSAVITWIRTGKRQDDLSSSTLASASRVSAASWSASAHAAASLVVQLTSEKASEAEVGAAGASGVGVYDRKDVMPGNAHATKTREPSIISR